MTRGIPKQAPTHYQPCVYDIDGDGNLEMLMADPMIQLQMISSDNWLTYMG